MKKSLIQKWAPVLESEIGAPIRRQQDAAVLATLLETQTRLNKGYLAESVNVTSDVAVYQQYALPLIRRQFPELLAMNTVSVIPTTTPSGIYFALRYLYDNADLKTSAFRFGQKRELGYDLEKNYTGFKGVGPDNRKWTTSEGEFLSNFMETNPNTGSEFVRTFNPDGSVASTNNTIRTASVKVIRGSVLVGTRAIKSHYTLELQQDLAAVHGQDIEALMLEALQFEIQQEIDREILAAQVFCATNPALGGEAVIDVDLDTGVTARWPAEKIAAGIANTILAVAQKIAVTSRMGPGNYVIASPDVVAALSTIQTGIYTPVPYLGNAVNGLTDGGVVEVGSLMAGGIKVYRDIYAVESYALVGRKGARQGESGVIFMPYIPYIFTKTAGQEDGSPRLIVKSRYAIVANLLGAGQFYRYIRFSNMNEAILGIDSSSDVKPWEVNPDSTFDDGGTFDESGASLGGVTPPDGDTGV
jgi:hypothetical protein